MLFSLIFYHNPLWNVLAGCAFSAGWISARLLGRFHCGYLRGRAQRQASEVAAGHVERGALPMNFAAKLNVVAAYAALALVCAIVFGMV